MTFEMLKKPLMFQFQQFMTRATLLVQRNLPIQRYSKLGHDHALGNNNVEKNLITSNVVRKHTM
jgi:hypothetical protein